MINRENPNYSIEDLKKHADNYSTMFDINWETLEKHPERHNEFETMKVKADNIIVKLEPVYVEMRLTDTRLNDDCWVNEELNMCIHDIEDRLVDAYAMQLVYEKYSLIKNITV